jgi:uncharacterized protein (AIM24 family)
MFCANCGTPTLEDQNFCRNCGHPVGAAGKPAVPAGVVPADRVEPPLPPRVATAAGGRCEFCGAELDASQSACPRCGAAVRRAPARAASGWTELPPRKDMAKLQFGHSSCQIEGLYVPVADMNLAAGDRVYFTHHVLLWKDPQVNITAMSLKGGWKRMFAGLPLIMTQAEGPGHIAFSKDDPGELIPVTLHPGQTVDVREHMLLTATANVAYDWFQTGVWFQTGTGKDAETHYPLGRFMDRFAATQTPGLLLLHAGGNVLVRELAAGQDILVKPSALVFKDPAVEMHLHFEHTAALTGGAWGSRYIWLRLRGPGRVAIQTVFARSEGESQNITSSSRATTVRWSLLPGAPGCPAGGAGSGGGGAFMAFIICSAMIIPAPRPAPTPAAPPPSLAAAIGMACAAWNCAYRFISPSMFMPMR